MMGATFTLIVRAVICRVSDATCGFKAFRADVGKDLFSRVRVDDWAFDAEILFLARTRGYRIVEVGVHWEDREGTKVSPLRDAVRSLRSLAVIRWNGMRGVYRSPLPATAAREIWRSRDPEPGAPVPSGAFPRQ